MRILIEEHQYQAEQIRDVLHGIDAMQDIDGNVSINYVGYYYNTQLNDCVFICQRYCWKIHQKAKKYSANTPRKPSST